MIEIFPFLDPFCDFFGILHLVRGIYRGIGFRTYVTKRVGFSCGRVGCVETCWIDLGHHPG